MRNHTLTWCGTPLHFKSLSVCHVPQGETEIQNNYNHYAPGGPLLIFPITAFGWILHKAGLFSVREVDPLLFWSVIGVYIAFLLLLILLFELAFALLKNEKRAFLTTVAISAGNPVLFYVFRRPLMVHSQEILLAVGFFFFSYKWWVSANKRALWAMAFGVTAGLIFLTRINDAFMVAVGGIILFFGNSKRTQDRLQHLAAYGVGASFSMAIFFYNQYAQTGSIVFHPEKYDYATAQISFFEFHLFNLRRYFDFFLGTHWGMYLLLPILLLETAVIFKVNSYWLGLFKKYKLMFTSIFLVVLLQINFLANYPTNSMSYSNRYTVIFTYFFHVMFLISWSKAPTLWESKKKLLEWGAAFLVLLGTMNMLNFE
ncbi:MAG: hypothetical protein PHV97_05045, partial [Candidatus Omnitrophica bacterium]|nr:hypothetical protein [Candidatus Omnitrophota bacterium]